MDNTQEYYLTIWTEVAHRERKELIRMIRETDRSIRIGPNTEEALELAMQQAQRKLAAQYVKYKCALHEREVQLRNIGISKTKEEK